MPGEVHRRERMGWLRAATLGANDGLITTSSLVVGMALAQPGKTAVLLAAVAGLVAGALAMAAGEYVSVSSQADAEKADLSRERGEIATAPVAERDELADIYVVRGLDRDLAIQVADRLMVYDALGAHARDELGIHEKTRARPVQAALASAAAFAIGAAPAVLMVALVPLGSLALVVVGANTGALAHPWQYSRQSWRCLDHTRRASRRVLGCAGHGLHCRGRACGWSRHLAAPRGRQA